MMGGGLRACAATLIPILVCARASAVPLDVTQWSLGVGVIAGFPNNVSTHFTVVTDPFQNQHSVTMQLSGASASYLFGWSPELGTGSFHIDSTLAAQGPLLGGQSLNANASGNIRVHLDSSLFFDASIGMDYALASGDRESSVSLSIARLPSPIEIVFDIGDHAVPVFGDPAIGTLAAAGSVLLTPGEYNIQYQTSLLSYSGSPSAVSTGTGFVEFHFNIPEPSALCPVACAILLFALRAGHRNRVS